MSDSNRRWHARAILIVTWAALLVGHSSAADGSDVQDLRERLERLEKQNAELIDALNKRKEVGANDGANTDSQGKRLDKKAVEVIVGAYIKAQDAKKAADAESSLKPTVRLHGRVQADALWWPYTSPGIGFLENPTTGNDPDNRYLFRRLRLTMVGDIPYNESFYKLDLEFADPRFPQFRDAYIGFNNLPFLKTVIVGNQKRPMCLDQWNSTNVNVFMERPLLGDIANENIRRYGVCAYGSTDNLALNWQYGIFTSENIQPDGNYTGDPFQPCLNFRVSGTPWYDESSGGRGYLHLGIANQSAWPDPFPNAGDPQITEARFRTRPELQTVTQWYDTGLLAGTDFYNTHGLEAALNIGPFSVVSEYMGINLHRTLPANSTQSSTAFFPGFYIYTAYFLTGEHQAWDREKGAIARVQPFEPFFLVRRCCGGRGCGWGAWQVALRYSYLDLVDGGILGGEGEAVTFGLNWWWTSHSRFMLNYVVGEINNRRVAGAGVPPPQLFGGDYQGLQIRFAMDW